MRGRVLTTPDKQEPMDITVSLGKTLNLGNYVSARVDIGITQRNVPSTKRNETVDELVAYVTDELAAQVRFIEATKNWPN